MTAPRATRSIRSALLLAFIAGFVLAGCADSFNRAAEGNSSGGGQEGEGPGDDDDATGPVDADGDGFTTEDDCDDGDSSVFPGNPEICDKKDNDCNGQVDDGQEATDGDEDGFACEEDCDDSQAEINPAQPEDCADGQDNDCNGFVDLDDAANCQPDGSIGLASFTYSFDTPSDSFWDCVRRYFWIANANSAADGCPSCTQTWKVAYSVHKDTCGEWGWDGDGYVLTVGVDTSNGTLWLTHDNGIQWLQFPSNGSSTQSSFNAAHTWDDECVDFDLDGECDPGSDLSFVESFLLRWTD